MPVPHAPRIMRIQIDTLAKFFADRLTVQERWLVLGFLGIVVLGSFVKYSRARPEIDASSIPATPHSTQPSTDDPR